MRTYLSADRLEYTQDLSAPCIEIASNKNWSAGVDDLFIIVHRDEVAALYLLD